MNNKNLPTDWTFHEVWNSAFEKRNSRPVVERDYLWASELGKSAIDVYLRLKGTEPTNIPDSRALRKMEAGNYFEYLVKLILLRAGVLSSSQERVEHQFDGLMKVTGRLDFIGGGMPNYEETKKFLEEEDAPETLKQSCFDVVEYLLGKYPDGVGEKIIEVKSVSLIAFEKIMRKNEPIDSHLNQLTHYMLGKQMPGMLLYLCRDDMRMCAFDYVITDELITRQKERVQFLTGVYNSDKEPEKEPLFMFDDFELKFVRNFNVQYSNYLTKLYNFEHPENYAEMATKTLSRWNRVLTRIKDGKDMTDNNLEALNEIAEHGFDVSIISKTITQK